MPNVLVFTSLFPNKVNPDFGVFIKRRMLAYAQRKDCNVMVVAPVPFSPEVKFLKKYYQYSQIPQHELIDGIMVYHPRYPLIPKISMPFHGKLIYHSTINALKKIHKEFSFDLIDAHFIYPDCQAGVLLGKVFNKPVVVTARGSDLHEYTKYPLIRPQISKTLQHAGKIISVCQALKDIMVGLNIEPDKISVIPNGIDTEKFFPKDKSASRQKLGIGTDKKVVLSVGSLIALKGHHLTIEAMQILKKKYLGIELYIIGKGSEKKRLEALAEESGLVEDINLLGQIPNDQLIDWYNAADVFCLASEKEGWANVLTESLSCGTPAVATNVFGSSEIIKAGSNGYLVQRYAVDIAKGIEKALEKEWDKNKIAQDISGRTWDVVAREVGSVFDEAINEYAAQ